MAAKKTVFLGISHALLRTEDLLAALNLPRSVGLSTLSQILFAFRRADRPVMQSGRSSFNVAEGTPTRYEFAMYLSASVNAQGIDSLRGFALCSPNSMSSSLCRRRVLLFTHLLEDIVSSEGRYLPTNRQDLALVSEVNCSFRSMDHWNYRLSELFMNQVRLYAPNKTAVILEDQCWTYRELWSACLSCAGNLQERLTPSASRQAVLLVCAPRSFELVVALLAVNALGAVYVPVDPAIPVDRLRMILEEVKPDLLILGTAEKKTIASLQSVDIQALELIPAMFSSADRIHPNLVPLLFRCSTDRLHNIIFTSGSTGRPKGVLVTECGMVNFLRDWARFTRATESDLVLGFTSIAFDPHSHSYFGPFTVGSRRVCKGWSLSCKSPLLMHCGFHDAFCLEPVYFWWLVWQQEASCARWRRERQLSPWQSVDRAHF